MATWKEKLTGKYTWTPPKRNTNHDDEFGSLGKNYAAPSSVSRSVIAGSAGDANQNAFKTPSYPSSLVQKNIDTANARTAEFNNIYEIMSKFDGEQTAYDPLYDAVKNLENGGHDYNAVYKAMENIGGESAMYDPVYDFVKKLEKQNGFDVPNIFDQRNEVVSALEGRIPHADNVTEFITQNPTHVNDVMGYPTQKPTTPTVSSAVASAMAKLQELRKKTYTDPYGDDLNRMIEEFNNRKAFDYQLNTDQLFLNAREQYMQQGQKAMRDAMGAAATMTGGYGNSYASQVGNQAYQQYLQELNDSIPEFYGSALDRYEAEGQQMLDKINLKDAQRKDDYAMWEAQYLRDLENAALDVDMAVADEQEKALQGTTAWDRLSDAEKEDLRLQYAKLGLNPDGSPLTYTDADGKVVASPVGTADKSKMNTELNKITEIYQTQGAAAATLYVDQLKSLGYSAEQLNEHLLDLDERGDEALFSSLSAPENKSDWVVTDMGGGHLFSGAINDNKMIRNRKTGEEYTLAEAKTKLLEQGYTESEANNVLKRFNNANYGGNDLYVERFEEGKTERHDISPESLRNLVNGQWEIVKDDEFIFGGINDNAEVKDPDTGKKYRLDELYKALERIGYNYPDAVAILSRYNNNKKNDSFANFNTGAIKGAKRGISSK